MTWRAFMKVGLRFAMGVWLADSIGAPPAAPAEESVRFQAMDLYVDSKQKPLAAYQLEFAVKSGDARIVGIEGGEHPAFQNPPFYDPEAIQRDRVILAAFSPATKDKLPKNKIRIATIHLQIRGEQRPQYSIKSQVAATPGGRSIPVAPSFKERNVQ